MYKVGLPITITIKSKAQTVFIALSCETFNKDGKIITLDKLKNLNFSSDSDVPEEILKGLVEKLYALFIEDHGGAGFYINIEARLKVENGVTYSYDFNRKGIPSLNH